MPVAKAQKKQWERGNVMLGLNAEARTVQKLPHDSAAKVVWGRATRTTM